VRAGLEGCQDPHSIDAVGLTAYQAVVDHLKASTGNRLLILGASGGVGGFGVSIATSLGVTVIGT
jgi:NADPH:quinone reductase-like Zn-dependent oxidoreductase